MRHTISLYYFPKGMRLTAPVVLLVAGYLWYVDWKVTGVILLFVAVFVLTAKYVTTIDLEGKEFIDTFQFYWAMDVGTERKKFTRLNKIVITKGSYSEKVTTRSSDRQLNWSDYTGTLIYDDINKLDLITTEEKSTLVAELKVYATSLNVPIEDGATSRLIFSPTT